MPRPTITQAAGRALVLLLQNDQARAIKELNQFDVRFGTDGPELVDPKVERDTSPRLHRKLFEGCTCVQSGECEWCKTHCIHCGAFECLHYNAMDYDGVLPGGEHEFESVTDATKGD